MWTKPKDRGYNPPVPAVEESILSQPKARLPFTQHHQLEVKKAVRRDYVEGKGSVKAIAERHSLAVDTVRTWLKAGHWTDLRREKEQADIAALIAPHGPIAQPAPITPIPEQSAVAMLATVNQQIAQVDDMIAEARDWRAIEALSRVKDRLISQWALLTGHPSPGTRKVRSGRPPAPIASSVPVQSPSSPTVQSQPVSPAPTLDHGTSDLGLPATSPVPEPPDLGAGI